MFILAELKNVTRIPPEMFNMKLNDAIAQELNKKLANKVTLYLIQNCSTPKIFYFLHCSGLPFSSELFSFQVLYYTLIMTRLHKYGSRQCTATARINQ